MGQNQMPGGAGRTRCICSIETSRNVVIRYSQVGNKVQFGNNVTIN